MLTGCDQCQLHDRGCPVPGCWPPPVFLALLAPAQYPAPRLRAGTAVSLSRVRHVAGTSHLTPYTLHITRHTCHVTRGDERCGCRHAAPPAGPRQPRRGGGAGPRQASLLLHLQCARPALQQQLPGDRSNKDSQPPGYQAVLSLSPSEHSIV